MSTSLSSAFIAEFSSDVHQAYQNGSLLKGTVRTVNDVEASTYRFPKYGKSPAIARGTASTDVVGGDFGNTKVTATLTDWYKAVYVDIFDLEKVNFDERQEITKATGSSLGRRLDQIIIGATATASTSSPDHVIEHGSTGLTLAKIVAASALLNAQGVDSDGRTFAHSAKCLEGALNDTKFTSADYASMRALMSGGLSTFMGFDWIMIEDRSDEGGLVLDSTTRTNIVYHRNSIGLAMGMEPSIKMAYIDEKMSWLVNGTLSAGAALIDTLAMVHVQTQEA